MVKGDSQLYFSYFKVLKIFFLFIGSETDIFETEICKEKILRRYHHSRFKDINKMWTQTD